MTILLKVLVSHDSNEINWEIKKPRRLVNRELRKATVVKEVIKSFDIIRITTNTFRCEVETKLDHTVISREHFTFILPQKNFNFRRKFSVKDVIIPSNLRVVGKKTVEVFHSEGVIRIRSP